MFLLGKRGLIVLLFVISLSLVILIIIIKTNLTFEILSLYMSQNLLSILLSFFIPTLKFKHFYKQ